MAFKTIYHSIIYLCCCFFILATDKYDLTEVEGSIQLKKGYVIVHRPSWVKVWMFNDIFNRQCLLSILPDS